MALLFVLPLFLDGGRVVAALGLPPAHRQGGGPGGRNGATTSRFSPGAPGSLPAQLGTGRRGVRATDAVDRVPGRFGLSQVRDPWRNRLLIVAVFLLMVPPSAVWLFRYQMLSWAGLLVTVVADSAGLCRRRTAVGAALLLDVSPHAGGSRGRGSESADAWTTYRELAMPWPDQRWPQSSCWPSFSSGTAFTNPVLYLYRPANLHPADRRADHKQLDATNWPLLMAGATFMTIPIILLFVVLQPLFLSDNSIITLLEKG
ncbi:hypothetical protein [Candidatus Amarolinea dominans]|uniref:hypothetical protein n=1 Tax=Candidatus Amarolinea dominans TaxID=3140696 RepID=UPI001DB06CE9|nr:hypothetical protein [Anaerolineae bacterium]